MSLEKHLQDNYSHNELADLANHGADGGFGDFIYYTDTVKYFETFKDECFAELNDYNESTGETGFPKYINDNMSEYHLFCNSMIWFAIENIARRLTNGEYMKEVD
jgi:hypothetical protein